MAELVNTDNFVRAETARMFDGTLGHTGGVNRWLHLREPTPLDRQNVIRMNRDTLYSAAVVDISDGATLHIPDVGDRYLSVMVVNEDHYINRVLREPGAHELTVDTYDTPYVSLSARLFVDPNDEDDVATVNELQDALVVEASSSRPYSHPEYDTESLDATRAALLKLSEGLPDASGTFGSAREVDPVRHLIGTAYGWGGLPEYEAFYVVNAEPRASGHDRIVFDDVPVDAFWSFTVYNKDGYFEPNEYGAYNVNEVTAVPNEDGTVTIDLAPSPNGYTNHIYTMDGWNYAIRFYRPRQDLLDGRWSIPVPQPVE